MAMLSRLPVPKDRPYDGGSQLSQYRRMCLGDLGDEFPKLRKDVDLADSDIHRIKKIQKYLKDKSITGIQNQMRIAIALQNEGVLSDRVWYTLHTLIAGNAIGKDLKDPFAALQDPINQKKKR